MILAFWGGSRQLGLGRDTALKSTTLRSNKLLITCVMSLSSLLISFYEPGGEHIIHLDFTPVSVHGCSDFVPKC